MTKEVFGKFAQTYDRARRQLVPCFDEFYDALISQIPYDHDAALRVLDLGAGTGLLSMFVAEKFPHARILLVDISEEMLKKAQNRFAGAGERFTFRLADFSEEPLPGRFHAVLSALAIHHLPHARKATLFHKVYDSLEDGGVFINADQVLGATPEIEARYHETWLRQVRARGVSAADLAAAVERMKDDKMATIAAQLNWLEEAGFRSVDCWYKSYNFAVYGGRKENQA
jgi:tRNA (cmo5U34)-methyltransferase